MLVLIGKLRQSIDAVTTLADVSTTLAEIASAFGFSGAILLQRRTGTSLFRVYDSDPLRGAALMNEVEKKGIIPAMEFLQGLLERGHVTRLGQDSSAEEHPYKEFCRINGMVDVTAVPVNLGGPDKLGGVVLYCGAPEVSGARLSALQSLSFDLFEQVRAVSATDSRDVHSFSPRELEVMRHAANGLGSAEIAWELGISERTVNQYVNSVGKKLGTRKRAHSVAILLRKGII